VQRSAGFIAGKASSDLPAVDARSVDREVHCRLRQSGYLAHSAVSCQAREGVLVLTGILPSHYLKQLALAIATDVAPDLEVVNRIAVGAGAHPARRSFETLPSFTLASPAR